MNRMIGIIVDGQGDFLSFKKRFQKGFKILKTDGPRGNCANPKVIVTKSRKQISILTAYKCDRVIVVLDFEERSQRYEDFVTDLRTAIKQEEFSVPVYIVVANIMIENWYLSDIFNLSKKKTFLKPVKSQKSYEGTHGKKVLKRFMINGISYGETIHGPQMFEILCFDTAKKNSSSFQELIMTLK